MSAWRREAIAHLPMYRDIIQEADTLETLWRGLGMEFWSVYNNINVVGSRVWHEPDDEKVIIAVYNYASWCLLQLGTSEAVSAVTSWFYQGVGLQPFALSEFTKYLTPEVFRFLLEADVIYFMVGADKITQTVEEYWEQRRLLERATSEELKRIQKMRKRTRLIET